MKLKKVQSAVLPLVVAMAVTLPVGAMAASAKSYVKTPHAVNPAVKMAPGGGCGNYFAEGPAHTSYTDLGPRIRAPFKVVPRFGATPQEIQRNFARIVESHFASGMAERIVDRLSDKELAGLAKAYRRSAGQQDQRLLKTFASRLSDKALLRVASAFGRTAVTNAVREYSSPAVKASFMANASAIVPLVGQSTTSPYLRAGGPGGRGGLPLPPPKPSSTDWRNTLRDIYLDYRTDSVLELTAGEALSATVIYTATAVAGAWTAGYAVGTGLNHVIETYDPSLGDAIGGTVAGMLDQGKQAWTNLEEGHLESSFDALFGLPISDSTQPFGPYGMTAPMVDYYQWSGAPSGFNGGNGWAGLCTNPYY